MIISVIKQIVESLEIDNEKFTFGLGPDYVRNEDDDELVFPAVYLDQPITNEYILVQSGHIGATYPIDLVFMYKTEDDDTPEEIDAKAIDPADRAIRQFITKCQESNDLINSVNRATAMEFLHFDDVDASGKILSIELDLRNDTGICLPNV